MTTLSFSLFSILSCHGSLQPDSQRSYQSAVFCYRHDSLILILIAIRNDRRANASLAWPSVQGRITSSQLVTSRVRGRDRSYLPRVEYEYSGKGQAYAGKRVACGTEGSNASPRSKATVQAMVDRYEVGTPVEVFYNPAHADFAILERRAASASKQLWLVGIMFFTVAVGRFLLYGFGFMK
jgi:Protein of unknown function (DUF3592)